MAPESAAETILFSSYFPRSMKLEGGTALIDAVARGLVSTGLQVTVHAPLEASSSLPYGVIDYHAGGHLSYFAYLRHLEELGESFRTVLALDHSPATALFSGRALRRHPNAMHYFVSPCQALGEIFKPPYSVQYLKHWLGKNAVLGYLGAPKGRTSIVATEFQRRQLCAMGVPEGQVAVIPYGIMEDRSRKVPRRQARETYGLPPGPVIGYMGHFSPIKGVPVLVEAFRRLHPKVAGSHLALAWSGKGAESKKVQRMIRDPGIADAVSLLGVVDPGAFLSSLDVCVLPYVHSSTPHFPLVMLEALAVGTPVMSTRVGGLEECAADTGWPLFVEPGDPVGLAETLETLLASQGRDQGSGEPPEVVFQDRFRAEVAAQALRRQIS
jgi:glycosyltransferase involved in cell wall biosynthesis